jgi:hypothetical protein
MNFLKNTSAWMMRQKTLTEQYWLDRLANVMLARGVGIDRVNIGGKVLAVVRHVELERELIVPGLNIVTNAGDEYYAERGAAETPGTDFATVGGIRLGSDNTAPTKTDTDVTTFLAGTGHAIDGTYPQSDDSDGDNPDAAADAVSYRYSYTTAQGNANSIIELAIVDNTTTPTVALTHALFAASFNKTSSDTLKVFVTHTFNGV